MEEMWLSVVAKTVCARSGGRNATTATKVCVR